MNLDAALDRNANEMSVATIIHNSKGEVMDVAPQPLLSTFLPRETEAKALNLSLLWARDIGLIRYSIETDTLVVVHDLDKLQEYLTEFGDLLQDVKEIS